MHAGLSAAEKQRVSAQGRRAGVRVGRQVFLSGRLSVDVDGTPIDGPFETHFARALDRLLATAARLRAAPDDIVWLQYLTPETPSFEVSRGAVIAAHRKRFPGPNRPATSLIGVAGLVVDGAQLEVTGLAVLPPCTPIVPIPGSCSPAGLVPRSCSQLVQRNATERPATMRVATHHNGFLGAHNLEDAGSNPARRIEGPVMASNPAVAAALVASCFRVMFRAAASGAVRRRTGDDVWR